MTEKGELLKAISSLTQAVSESEWHNLDCHVKKEQSE